MKFPSNLTFLFATLLLLTGLSSCRQDITAKEMSDSVANYIYAYTSGTISKAEPIKIQLTNSVDLGLVGTEVESGVLSFSPSIAGTAVWENEQTIIFQPSEHLPSNKNYLGKLALNKVFLNVPKEAGIFEFNFATREQHFYISVEGLRNDPTGDEKKKQLTGWLNTADLTDNAAVEKIVEAKQNGKAFRSAGIMKRGVSSIFL